VIVFSANAEAYFSRGWPADSRKLNIDRASRVLVEAALEPIVAVVRAQK